MQQFTGSITALVTPFRAGAVDDAWARPSPLFPTLQSLCTADSLTLLGLCGVCVLMCVWSGGSSLLSRPHELGAMLLSQRRSSSIGSTTMQDVPVDELLQASEVIKVMLCAEV